MNFFARQDAARRQSRRLFLLFGIAVVAIAAAVNFVVLTVLFSAEAGTLMLPQASSLGDHLDVVIANTLIVLGIIGLAGLYKSSTLQEGGGATVARSLGGTRIDRNLDDPRQHRLFNVVEEMAIASGVPMPEVYVLEQEAGINAFAAGHSPANAAVAVTRGALEKLNRSELQGVIAHEFSHILNGDMRISMRLMGLVFGLLVIALAGRTVLRHAPRVGSGGRKAGGAAAIMLAAFAVMVIGYLGVFFGRLIQAAIARQRETLADASAVQFTREPQGLRGALVKIGAHSYGSELISPQTDEVAHMLFASGMSRLFATHPALVDRIRALDPRFDPAEFAQVRAQARVEAHAEAEAEKGRAPASMTSIAGAIPLAILAAGQVSRRVGNPGTADVDAAQALVSSLPASLLASLDSPRRALGLLLSLVLDPKPEVRERQRSVVREKLGASALDDIVTAEGYATDISAARRLPLLGMIVPSLRRLPRGERIRILETLHRLIMIDGRIEIFEYALATLARLYLHEELDPAASARKLRLDDVVVELQTALSTLARHGAQSETQARHAYELGMHHLLPGHRPEYRPVAGWPKAMDRALVCLDRLVPAAKELLVEALVLTISHDNQMTIAEGELLRTICAAIHCPLPPLLGEEALPHDRSMRSASA